MHPQSRFRLDPAVVRFSVESPEAMTDRPVYRPGRIIGQPRAVEALRLAVAIRSKGYNVFAAGSAGTGKRSTVMRILREQRLDRTRLRDAAFVNNFARPDRPRVLYFSPGDADRFRRRMQALVEHLREEIPSELDKAKFRSQRDEIMMAAEARETAALADFSQRVESQGFAVQQVNEEQEQRSDLHPIIDGEPIPMERLNQLIQDGTLARETGSSIRTLYYRLMDEMNQVFLSLRGDRAAAERKLRALERAAVQPLVAAAVEEVASDFVGDEIRSYLHEIPDDVAENLDLFLHEDPERAAEIDAGLQRYGVNVIVDHGETTRPPVVLESHPDYAKLFGGQEGGADSESRPGFMTLRGGSLLAASGGYLVLRAEDILGHEEVWNGLKRVLQDEEAEIRSPSTPFGQPHQLLKPEPIRTDVKVVLMGSEHIYDALFYTDEEFGKLFKVLSEFDSVMENTPETRTAYVDFMHMICEEESLLPMAPDGKSAILEYGVRLSEFRNRLSTRFTLIADLIREASHWATVNGSEAIDRAAVERARDVRRFLHNLPEEKYDEQISSGEMILQVTGERIGAINGLSVLDRGYYAFGRPMLITARVAPGTDGITNIERESGLSGELHDKGVYIIQGFIQATYANDFPLSINASIGFEQSYAEVDGDSASSTEIYVLLSAIGDIPLRQDIAVTGSVNQFGQIQPVGGISEKIEGFYATCKLMGLTGRQGVIIPRTNIENLIVSPEVQAAVDQDRFHIFAIDTVDDGIEILTGIRAGERGNDGHFPKDSVNGIVERRLREMAQQVKEFS